MPKTPTKTSKSARALSGSPVKTPSGSSRTRATATEPVDESTWRTSRISSTRTVSKTIALKMYLLDEKKGDLRGVSDPVVTGTGKFLPSGRETVSHLYKEREIELAAWRKFGGPTAFEAALAERRRKYKGTGPFPWPHTYGPGDVYIVSPSKSRYPDPDIYVTSDRLRDMKEKMVEKASGEIWLWEEWNLEIICKWGDSRKHERLVEVGLRDLPKYPPRIPLPKTLPPELQVLQGVLDRAIQEKPGVIDSREDFVLDHTFVFWTDHYFNEVFDALISVIKKLGLGREGWETARWMVYRAYAKSLGGIKFYSEVQSAADHASGWLLGRVHRATDLGFEFGWDSVPAKWEAYNALLPVIDH